MKLMQRWLQSALKTLFILVVAVSLSVGLGAGAKAEAQLLLSALPPGNAVTNGAALLRHALPIDNGDIRNAEAHLEAIAAELRGKRWSAIAQNVSAARRVLTTKGDRILAAIPMAKQAEATTILADLAQNLTQIDAVIERKDKEQTFILRKTLLDQIGAIEVLMVQAFPFEVPAEFSHLPQLKGRATIAIATTKGDMTVVVDGYNAPLSAGDFVDLVQRGFYDGLEFSRVEENFLAQTGDPPGAATGFIDPATGRDRTVPLEIRVQGDEEPIYSFTLESIGRYMDEPMLPFSALGTLAIARPLEDPDGGSSQVFFQIYDAEVTPAGRNLLDGRYAAFGYVVENESLLKELELGDRILSAQVIQGAENLVQPST